MVCVGDENVSPTFLNHFFNPIYLMLFDLFHKLYSLHQNSYDMAEPILMKYLTVNPVDHSRKVFGRPDGS